jgi:dTDP-4-amino-4,6-dideoxygalactose transaminase
MSLPVTERIHQQEVSLPIGPELTTQEAVEVAQAINQFR